MKKYSAILLFLSILAFTPFTAHAICEGPLVPCGPGMGVDCTFCHIFELINNIFEFFLTCLVPIVAVFMFVVAGFLLMVSRGGVPGFDAGGNLFTQARGALNALVVGIVIIFVSWALLNAFMQAIGVAKWTGLAEGWWEISCTP
ncbi:MAG: hypothetical protein GF370_04880 [Candidatus Nealsonbacteria bacterium]|nr:hypothetical protein [Candidatus Nealsonbacteria bacterium]